MTLADVNYAKEAAAQWYLLYAPRYLPMSDDPECLEWIEYVALTAYERQSIDLDLPTLWRAFEQS